jgi:hypothetical protein
MRVGRHARPHQDEGVAAHPPRYEPGTSVTPESGAIGDTANPARDRGGCDAVAGDETHGPAEVSRAGAPARAVRDDGAGGAPCHRPEDRLRARGAPELAVAGLAPQGRRPHTSPRRTQPGVVDPVTDVANDPWTADFKGRFRAQDCVYRRPPSIADQHALPHTHHCERAARPSHHRGMTRETLTRVSPMSPAAHPARRS